MTNVKLLERREARMYEGLMYTLTDDDKQEIVESAKAYRTAMNNKVRILRVE